MNTPMTPEQKIITIAEFDGWTVEETEFFKVLYPPGLKHYGFCCGKSLTDEQVWNLGLQGNETGSYRFPPYLTSRDAICGAVARLDNDKKRGFSHMLRDIVFGIKPEVGISHIVDIRAEEITNMILATPAQLADALLLTLGYEI